MVHRIGGGVVPAPEAGVRASSMHGGARSSCRWRRIDVAGFVGVLLDVLTELVADYGRHRGGDHRRRQLVRGLAGILGSPTLTQTTAVCAAGAAGTAARGRLPQVG